VVNTTLLHVSNLEEHEVSNQIRENILILIRLLIAHATQFVIEANLDLFDRVNLAEDANRTEGTVAILSILLQKNLSEVIANLDDILL
jgi:hypothetical protein